MGLKHVAYQVFFFIRELELGARLVRKQKQLRSLSAHGEGSLLS